VWQGWQAHWDGGPGGRHAEDISKLRPKVKQTHIERDFCSTLLYTNADELPSLGLRQGRQAHGDGGPGGRHAKAGRRAQRRQLQHGAARAGAGLWPRWREEDL